MKNKLRVSLLAIVLFSLKFSLAAGYGNVPDSLLTIKKANLDTLLSHYSMLIVNEQSIDKMPISKLIDIIRLINTIEIDKQLSEEKKYVEFYDLIYEKYISNIIEKIGAQRVRKVFYSESQNIYIGGVNDNNSIYHILW